MVRRGRVNEELRRLRQAIRSDSRIFERVDRDGNGRIDGAEWEHVRRAVVERLEHEADSTATGPPRLETCDHLALEWFVDRSLPVRLRHRGPQLEFDVRTGGDHVPLGVFEQLSTLTDIDRRHRTFWHDRVQHYSIRPVEGDHVRVRRYPTFLGEALEVCSVYGRTIARVKPQVRVLRYAYRIDSEDERTLRVARRRWDGRCERLFVHTNGPRKRPRSRKLPDPYHLVAADGHWKGFIEHERFYPDPKNRRKYYRRWVVRLEPGQLTPAMRWGVIGALAFILRGPFMLRGWFWKILDAGRS